MRTFLFVIVISLALWESQGLLNFPYQAHGFNDLDFFLQQMKKGVDIFKVDISQATKEVCGKFSSWNPAVDGDLCEELDYFQICCLGFRGDTSPKPILDEYFNTTWDMIRLLQNEQYDYLWKRGSMLTVYNYTKYIAMNFQYSHPFSKLSKDYLYKLVTTIRDRDLDIQLIFGMDDFILNYDEKCLIERNCSHLEQTISDSNVILQSSSPDSAPYNPKDVKGRYRNFNTNFKNLDYVCDHGFPDWMRNSGTPVIFWEPSDEKSVRWVMDRFTSASCKRDLEHNSTKQLRITSNLEPEMVQTFHNQFNQTGDSVKILVPNSTLIGTNMIGDSLLLLLTVKADSFELVAQLIDLEGNFKTIGAQTINNKTSVLRAKFLETFILLECEKELAIYGVSSGEKEFRLSLLFSFAKADLHFSASLFKNAKTGEVDLAELAGSPTTQFLNIYSLKNKLSPRLIKITVDLHFPVVSSDLAVAWDFGKSTYEVFFSYESTDETRGSGIKGLYSALLSLSPDLDRVVRSTSSKSPYDFGSQPSINLVYSKERTLFVLQAHTNGLCQCGLEFNNNQYNKCKYHENPKHFNLINSENMINYAWGKLEDYLLAIEKGAAINGCHHSIMHAKIYNGLNPLASGVFRNKNNQLQALIAHNGVEYDDLPLPTRLFCGSTGLNLPSLDWSSRSVYVHTIDVVDFELFEYF